VPFGAIASTEQSITWPPEDAIEMNVLGFEDAYNHCLSVRLSTDPDVVIPFSSLAGLALMKIISWNDGFTGNTGEPEKRLKKDSSDLLLLIRHYEVIDKGVPFEEKRLYQHEDILNAEDFDHTRAYARLLGRDIAKISDAETLGAVLEILEREADPKCHLFPIKLFCLKRPGFGPEIRDTGK
jgi:predicted nucleotidyltransferase